MSGSSPGACFADFGHDVICVDKDAAKIEALRAGRIPIFEPGLDHLVAKNAAAGRLSFTTDLAPAVANAEAVFIAVGTPSRRGDGHADLAYVYAAAKEIAEAITGFTVIVDKSTVPVGTGDEVERIIRETNPGADFAVISNPNSCAKAPRSTTSSGPTASSSAATIRAGSKSCGRFTARWPSAARQ